MNINNFQLSKNAQFFKITSTITKTLLKELFKAISSHRDGNYIINETKIVYDKDIKYSVVSFKTLSEPAFLISSGLKETRYAYLLLIEYNDFLAIFKKNVKNPEKYLTNNIDLINYTDFCYFLGDKKPEYEKISMKNMSISDAVIRARSLEARNLDGIIPVNSSSRSIPRNFRLQLDNNVFTLTPNTSRINKRDKRSEFDDICTWTKSTIDEISRIKVEPDFFSNFASPISLCDIIKDHKIIALFFDFGELHSYVMGKNPSLKMYKVGINGNVEFNKEELKTFFNVFNSPVLVENNKLIKKGIEFDSNVKTHKKSITIRCKLFNKIILEDRDGTETLLNSYVNLNKPFSATFDSPYYTYFSNTCFMDKKLLSNIKYLLNIFNDQYSFSDVESEKEKPHSSNIINFPDSSLFKAVEDIYCAKKGVLICDDMGDEWADHIYISEKNTLTFIHSKFVKEESYGASKFHEVVSQALKNIGRLYSTVDEFKAKYDGQWSENYEKTNITRVRGSKNWTDISNALDSLNSNPNAKREIVLATPFLKKSILKKELEKLSLGKKVRPHYIQLVWLINTFISSCQDYGINAKILCKA